MRSHIGRPPNRLAPDGDVKQNITQSVPIWVDCRSKLSASVAIRSKLSLLPSKARPFDLNYLLDNPSTSQK